MELNLSKRNNSSFLSLVLCLSCEKQKHNHDHVNRKGIFSIDEIGSKSLIPLQISVVNYIARGPCPLVSMN